MENRLDQLREDIIQAAIALKDRFHVQVEDEDKVGYIWVSVYDNESRLQRISTGYTYLPDVHPIVNDIRIKTGEALLESLRILFESANKTSYGEAKAR